MEPSIVEMSTTMFMNKMRASVQSSPRPTPEELQSRLVKKAQTTKKEAEATKKRAEDVRKRTEVTKKRTEVPSDDDDDDFQMASEYQEWNRPQVRMKLFCRISNLSTKSLRKYNRNQPLFLLIPRLPLHRLSKLYAH